MLVQPNSCRFGAILALSALAAGQSDHPPVKVPLGFEVDVVYAVPESQGSWVSLANADRGRLIACDQGGELHRITLGDEVSVEPLATGVGKAQGLLWAFGSLYVMGRDGDRSGLFRLTDTTGDDRFDRVEHLLQLKVGGEHDGHAIVLGPDGESLYVCAGNMAGLPKPDFTSSRMPRVFRGDHVIERMPDARGHNTGAAPIGGWVARLSPDGAERELIANGFRNHYDIAFDANGELFTYDSDMEWDIGCAWYRPTRICHVVSGAEFGWRYGTGKWPAYFADSLPSVIDVGPGSPTGVVFGTGTRFPARYQTAMFAADWSYGVIYAVHLAPHGASYTATTEAFAVAAPFPVTDIVVRPDDGALYFTVGGRGARSALYRIRYSGDESTAPAAVAAVTPLCALRRRLESLHSRDAENAVAIAWEHLGHSDRHIRFAARLAIENRQVESWQKRVLAEEEPRALVHAVIALARHGSPELRGPLLEKLLALQWNDLSTEARLELLRAYGLVFARMEGTAPERAAVGAALARVFPASQPDVDRELCRILCHLDAPSVVGDALRIQAEAPSQEEQMHYAYCLRVVTRGWTLDSRRAYLEWFHKAAGYRGGASFLGFCRDIRRDAIERIPEDERVALGELVTVAPEPKSLETGEARSFVKLWTVAELLEPLTEKTGGHDFARGRRMFGAAACIRCHRFRGEGGALGPDLSSVGGRFGIREILEATIEPSKVISDQYTPTIFELKNGDVVVGYVANYSGGSIKVAEDMLRPGDFTAIPVKEIAAQRPSPISMMPPALLSTLTADEIADLIAYLRSGGDPDHPLFK